MCTKPGNFIQDGDHYPNKNRVFPTSSLFNEKRHWIHNKYLNVDIFDIQSKIYIPFMTGRSLGSNILKAEFGLF